MCITLNYGEFSYKSYDKREDYSFEVIRYPDISGNIPFNPAYGVLILSANDLPKWIVSWEIL